MLVGERGLATAWEQIRPRDGVLEVVLAKARATVGSNTCAGVALETQPMEYLILIASTEDFFGVSRDDRYFFVITYGLWSQKRQPQQASASSSAEHQRK